MKVKVASGAYFIVIFIPRRDFYLYVDELWSRTAAGAVGHFNQAIDGVFRNNQKARQNPKALAQLDGYKRGLVNSLTGNLRRFGFEKTAKTESLQEIIDEMREANTEETVTTGHLI